MNTKQKIAFILADYAVHVIAARHFPELAKLESIRSVGTANAAYYAALITNYATDAARTATCAANVNVNHIIDMRQLINIAIDPNKYW